MSESAWVSLSDATRVHADPPFFITGSGRCGTTLMRRLVMERSQAVIPPENYVLPISRRIMQHAGGDWAEFCRLVLASMQQASTTWAGYGIDADAALALLACMPEPARDVAWFWHAFHAIYARRADRPDARGWGDKTPASVNALPELRLIFPAAKFIFMVRDAFDVAHSFGCMQMPGRAGNYLGGARRWLEANAKALDFAARHPGQALLVRYEDLVRAPEPTMQAVLAFLALPGAACGALSAATAQEIAAQPYLRNALDAVSVGSIGKGRALLDRGVKARIAVIAGAMQVRLGYEPSGRSGGEVDAG